MSDLGDVRAWLRAHPRAADAVVALLVLIPAVTVPADAPRGLASASPAANAIIVAGCLLLILRRRFPQTVWLATLGLAAWGVVVQAGPTGAVFPVLVALYTVATRVSRLISVVAAIATAAVLVCALWAVSPNGWQSPSTYVALAWSGLAIAIGIAVKNQRAIVAAAVERADRAEQSKEEEAERRVEQERLRIARELHDVVAHHIAVINVQSGVALHLLEWQPEAARESIGHVRDATQEVMSEMTALLGLLRASDDATPTAPSPGLDRLDDLIEAMRHAGLTVAVHQHGQPSALPTLVSFTGYRVVQESLTNAHKHGDGTAELRLNYSPATTIIEIENPAGVVTDHIASDGHGLIGMKERVAAAGGRLETGPTRGGTFLVHVELPIKATATTEPHWEGDRDDPGPTS
jgi:signal transduction histidine kinase